MSSVLQPTGLRVIGRLGNVPYEGGLTAYPLTTNNATKLAVGDAVALVAGSIVPLTATPVAGTLSANSPVGVVAGFEYTDPSRGFVCSQKLAANAITNLLYTNVQVLVVSDPEARFVIQSDGPVTAAQVGSNASLAGFGAADMVLGTSRMKLDSTTITTSGADTKALRIVGIEKSVDNAAGDAFTKVVVKWNAGVHSDTLAGSH